MINEGVKNGRKIYGTDGKELQFNYVDDDNEE